MPQNRYNNTKQPYSAWLRMFFKSNTYTTSLAYGIGVLMVIFYFSIEKNPAKRIEKNITVSFNSKERQEVGTATKIQPDLVSSIKSKPNLLWKVQVIKSGDSLSSIFQRSSLSSKDVHDLISSPLSAPLLKIQPGQKMHLGLSAEGELIELIYIKSKLESYFYTKSDHIEGNKFTGRRVILSPEVVSTYRESIIKDSLFLSGDRVNLPYSLIMELANIFGWDIDFALDIRKGDRFFVLYEENFLDGIKISTGNILAAEFINQGISYTAVRYLGLNGEVNYYTPKGYSMQKTFLRAPLDFTRISSNFNLRRKHPIHKKIIAHRGVDYASPRGTPVFAAGDGKIIASSYSKANGNYVFIKHGQKITTKYIHLHKRKVKKGQKVSQRQVIGTVGSTGYATGPHLHYEFLINGAHRNPRTVSLPQTKPIEKSERVRFKQAIRPIVKELRGYQKTSRLAMTLITREKNTDN